MRTLMKVLAGLVGLIVLLIVGLAATVQMRWDRTYEAEVAPDLRAVDDSVLIERGRYLAYGPAHCAYCHTPKESWPALEAGEEPPMIGGYNIGGEELPFGRFYTPNITPDPETGIGSRTDEELVRLIRHGIRADGQPAPPFMEFQMLSDDDLRAILSFLRAQEPVRNEVPDRELTFLGKALLAFGILSPVGPSGTPPAESPPAGPTVERGEYIANNVAQCGACHTERNLMDGSFIGPRFAGGFLMEHESDPSMRFATPNLTPDAETGVIADWSEEQFLERFRAGSLIDGSPMPWSAFAQMSDDDLRAVYRYLTSLEPVRNNVGPVVRTVEE